MSLLDKIKIVDSGDTVNFNTGTLYDLATGSYVQGKDKRWYLNGGLSPHINTFVGPNGSFKSTTACSLTMRSMGIYYDADTVILDTENSLDRDKPRILRMGEDLVTDDQNDRILWLKGIDYSLDDFFLFIKDLCRKKEEDKATYRVKTPFIDINTGDNLVVYKPTYVFVDSLSALRAVTGNDILGIGSSTTISENNTTYMIDGNRKTAFISEIRGFCQKYGIVLVLTAHFSKSISMDPYHPNPKDTTFSLQDWKAKGVGKELQFLSSVYSRTKTNPLLDNSKQPLYGGVYGPIKDGMEVELTLERCKTSAAGESLLFVETQTSGLLNTVTNYHYLRQHDYYGLGGNKQRQQTYLLPDVSISRNTIRDLAKSNYQLRRALEITAQYCYIHNNWVLSDLPVDFTKDPKEVLDALTLGKEKGLVEEILNSRGYWSYLKNDRPYMSLYDVLEKLAKK